MTKRALVLRVLDVLRDRERSCPSILFGDPYVRDIAASLNLPHIAVGRACDQLRQADMLRDGWRAGTVRMTRRAAIANDINAGVLFA